MSSIRRPRNWLCVAAFAAAFWITLRVVAAAPPPRLELEPTALGEAVAPDEIRDPTLERLIAEQASNTGDASRWRVTAQ